MQALVAIFVGQYHVLRWPARAILAELHAAPVAGVQVFKVAVASLTRSIPTVKGKKIQFLFFLRVV